MYSTSAKETLQQREQIASRFTMRGPLCCHNTEATSISRAIRNAYVCFAFGHLPSRSGENSIAITIQFVFPADKERFRKPVPQFENDFGSWNQFHQQSSRSRWKFPCFHLSQMPIGRLLPDVAECEITDRSGMKNGRNVRARQRAQLLAQTRRRRKSFDLRRFSLSVPGRLLPDQKNDLMSFLRQERG